MLTTTVKEGLPIYTAVNAEAAAAALDDLDAKWGARSPAIIRLWRNAWEEFSPFLDYDGGDPQGYAAPTRSKA